jgi:NAD+-dependent secondary alcohol dehydrogenase Adh1
MFGNFLLITAQFGSSSRNRALADHRSINQKSKFLLFILSSGKCSVPEQKRRHVWSDVERGEPTEMQRTSRISNCYGLGTALAHLLGEVGRHNDKMKKPPTGRDKQMKAAVLHAFDEKLTAKEFVKYEEVTDPKISRPMDVIVRIGGAGVCRTDLHIVEGIWRSKVDVKLPYIMGHENAGWVEAIGPGVEGVKVGDSVICHPLVTSGHCLACRRGDDMHALDSSFPGINANGGYAQYLLTGQRALIKLPASLAPKDVAPYTDAGLTAYRAAKKASRHLLPGEYVAVIGAGGLGHIGIQVLAALCAAEIIVIDRADKSLDLAKECGAHHVVKADGNEVEAVLALTGGRGAEAVIDFVGEGDAIAKGISITANGGYYYIVGYGGKIELPTIDMITTEKTIVGNLVGTYAELVELMALADRGLVNLHTKEYKLNQANDALHDLHHGRIHGRAVLIP